MRKIGRFAGILILLLPATTAAAQAVRDTERPVPQLQFGTTGSFSGFQFQQSTFGSPIGNPIAFSGIPFPGFGSNYDVSPPERFRSQLDETPTFTPRNVADAFDARFVPSRFPWTPRITAEETARRSWRIHRGDPFEAPSRIATRTDLERHRQPFGALPDDAIRNPPSRMAVRSAPAQRIATEADVRGGRRRPFD